jgi:mannose-6-phosphate isomerase
MPAALPFAVQRIDKPWGYELVIAKSQHYVGKVIVIHKGHKLSLQYHREKEETFFLSRGLMQLVHEVADSSLSESTMRPGDSFHIPPGAIHRMVALEDCEVFEVSTPQLQDVVRLEDSYGRS